ncbi:unnamed protein product [Adineta ricciae]|uniref:G-protein coupled receptors family 1 profile domain-containing protein n=1 Tax=Adineta ricciae TaxID=249248 RepID=A0A814P8H9_ADIRI|nr:unnamed protein product [Adineta ricciae]CAF1514198.1 unnamed protein product [Adineta ricciae]
MVLIVNLQIILVLLVQQNCDNYCSSKSLCRPQYDHYGQKPLCICSMNSYGPRCFIERQCQMKTGANPCQNGGICVTKYEHYNLIDSYKCKCPKYYFGPICQYRSGSIEIHYVSENHSVTLSGATIKATVIQLFSITNREELDLEKQILYKDSLPSHVIITSGNNIHPLFGLVKLYTNQSRIQYHLLYANSATKSTLNLTLKLNKENYCPHTNDIFNLLNDTYQTRNIVAKYHTLCENITSKNSSLLCFIDDNYFCLCDENAMAQCFPYNEKFDQCKECLVQGRCIKGNIDSPNDYLCLCPRCHFGSKCQHNTAMFSFTLDSLISPDFLSISSVKKKVSLSMYIFVPALLCATGAISNLFAYVTFRQPNTRQHGVGYYFFTATIFSQLSLFCLFGRVFHIIINTQGFSIQPIVNIVLCKTLSFLLSISGRIYYWLIVFVTIERVYVVIYPTEFWLKQPRVAKKIIVFIIICTCASHAHELIKYTIVNDPHYATEGNSLHFISKVFVIYNIGKWCVMELNHSFRIYNQINTMIHYLSSFLMNTICTAIILIVVTRVRANADRKKSRWQIFQQELKKKKEMLMLPVTILISALPHLIISFTLACTDLDTKWQRYMLIISYFAAYIPPSLSFHLCVHPSKLFLHEFHTTKMWKILKRK